LIAEAEIKRTLHGGGDTEPVDEAALRRMAGAMISKFLHDPTRILKSDCCHGNRQELLDLTHRLFNLDEP
jgi:glutamyl-tRNA reductase